MRGLLRYSGNLKKVIMNNVKAKNKDKIMQIDELNHEQVKQLVNEAETIAVIPSKVAGADAFFAAAGLYLLLKEKYNDGSKEIKFVFQGKIPNKCEKILDDSDIVTNLAERELMLSIDYSGSTKGAKLQYLTEDQTLHLKVSPIPKNFTKDRIKARVTGFDFDVAFVIGAQELADLGPIYSNLRHEINNAKKINLDITGRNTRFGVVNVIDKLADNLSTLVFKYASNWELIPNKRIAAILLKGITYNDVTINKG